MSEPSATESVFVLDDEPALLRLMARVLERAGFRVHTATRSDDAAAFVARTPGIHAVVLDMAAPPGGAGEVLEAVRALGARTGVVVTSGEWIGPPLRRLLDACRGVFLEKPFKPDGLVDAVTRAVDRARPEGGA